MQALSTTCFDVAVIGGGITGCATAWYLAQDGVSVALLEAGDLNAHASGSNAGSLHAQIPHDTFLDLGEDWAKSFIPTLRLLSASIDLWRKADDAFDGALEVQVKGGLMLASSDQERRSIARKAAIEQDADIAVEPLDKAALQAMAPYLSSHLQGAGFCAAEGKANPLVAAPMFARRARALGAQLFLHTPVSALEKSAHGYDIKTHRGWVKARRVVISAGAGTPQVTSMLGLGQLPMLAVPIQACVTEPVAPIMPQLLYYARAPLTMKQTAIGTILIGGGWPARLDQQQRPVPDPHSLGQNLGLALEVMPGLAKVTVMRTWAATVNGTDDWKPIIGKLPGAPGVVLSYVPWMGFTGGPAAARIAASLVQDKSSDLDLAIEGFAPR